MTVIIVFPDNNLILAKQTYTKMTFNNIKNDSTVHRAFFHIIELEHHNWRSVVETFTTSDVNNVLCCTNGVRVDDVYYN